MAQKISQGNIFGRIGTGLGKGLAEQVPKEIERSRMASGLEELGKQEGLTPFQQFSGLLGVPGVAERPQVIQTAGELLRHQAQRNQYANRSGQAPANIPASAQPQGNSLKDIRFANLNHNAQVSPTQQIPQGNLPEGQPQIVEKNPLSQELQPVTPWTPEQRDSEISRVWDQNPNLTFQDVSKIVSDNERRYLESPQAYREQQQNLEDVQNKVNTEIESQLRKKLQIPKDQEIFSKLPGESWNRIERGVSKDLRIHPESNVKDLVNKWTDRALENAKSKSELKNIGERSWDEKIGKQRQNFEKLTSMSKSFKDFGNSEEYYNTLREKPFGLSPEGAASIAYPLSKSAKSYIDKIKTNPFSIRRNGLKYAHDLGDFLTRDDSVLSIAKNIKEKDPAFDAQEFLSEVRSIQDELGLSQSQKRELETRGTFDIFPNWGDLFLFPKGR